MALRSELTVAPDGSHCDRRANGWGSSGGATAPPDDALPRITKNDHDGTIAQGPRSTAISEENDDTARTWTARMPNSSGYSAAGLCSNGPSTSVSTVDASN